MKVFDHCNVCGTKIRTEEEDQMGMCERCADEFPKPKDRAVAPAPAVNRLTREEAEHEIADYFLQHGARLTRSASRLAGKEILALLLGDCPAVLIEEAVK